MRDVFVPLREPHENRVRRKTVSKYNMRKDTSYYFIIILLFYETVSTWKMQEDNNWNKHTDN